MTVPSPRASASCRPRRGGRLAVCGALSAALMLGMGAVAAADWPAMRHGVWLFTRKAPVDPIYDLEKPLTSTTEICVEQPGDLFVDPNNQLLDLCNFTPLQRRGDTYTASSACTIPMWRAKLKTRRITKIDGDRAYHTRFETEGAIDGKHVKWTETVSAKWIGPCPDSDDANDGDGGSADPGTGRRQGDSR